MLLLLITRAALCVNNTNSVFRVHKQIVMPILSKYCCTKFLCRFFLLANEQTTSIANAPTSKHKTTSTTDLAKFKILFFIRYSLSNLLPTT